MVVENYLYPAVLFDAACLKLRQIWKMGHRFLKETRAARAQFDEFVA
jgi:hypothetical protein